MTPFICNRYRLLRTPLAAFTALLAILAANFVITGQTNDGRGKNNPFSPSPSPKTKQEQPPQIVFKNDAAEVSISSEVQKNNDSAARPTIAQATFKIAKTAAIRTSSPVEIYKIGAGDVLFIKVKNTTNASGYYTVHADGTIDFPLAGENLVVAEQTTDEIEDMLAAGITLYADPQVEVKVREFGSHKITVAGMAERPGEKSIQREAIPLYVVRAEAGVNSQATRVLIRRADLEKVETYDLRDSNTDNVLVYPGNTIEFIAEGHSSVLKKSGFYYIAGSVNSTGQKEFTAGMTLFQAIFASGGAKGNPKKATIRRKNENGTLNVAEHNVRAIKDGKAPDPTLEPGDMIEIGN